MQEKIGMESPSKKKNWNRIECSQIAVGCQLGRNLPEQNANQLSAFDLWQIYGMGIYKKLSTEIPGKNTEVLINS